MNTEDMGEVAKESSEEEVEVGKEALVDKDENFSCEHCEKGFATFSIKATHVKNVHSNTDRAIPVNFMENPLEQLQ